MFFTFNQNNSGGGFDFDEARGITEYVIVEADTADEANERAESIGLYFDGDGDCPCCGDRWYAQWSNDRGREVPSIYDEPVETATALIKWMGDNPDVFVHYADGRVAAHHLPKSNH
ncbi:DUF7296 family protein [Streptomyces asiaticus]|uniref:DUF7296 family protein n=1 Tax=Streptomyces asiaticus TaxID=114695 RepID=UPI001BAD8C09|nr:hypothetical protein [Streptomyces asiaticus]